MPGVGGQPEEWERKLAKSEPKVTRSKRRHVRRLEDPDVDVEKLEEDLMWNLPHYEDPRILKRPGVIDQPSESYRIDLEENGFNDKLMYDILLNGNKKVQHIALLHPDLSRDIILRFKEESPFLKVQKRAAHLLTNKQYML